MTSQPEVLYEVRDRIAVIRLNRPDSLNALTPAMELSLRHAVTGADAESSVRTIILTGSGRGFCAGADIGRLDKPDPTVAGNHVTPAPGASPTAETNADSGSMRSGLRRTYGGRFGYFVTTRKPIIAALNGSAAGIGLVLALYADVRFAGSDAKFSTSFAQRGLAAEAGISWLLPRLVGPAHALDLLMSARKIDAFEAERLGLVNKVFPKATFMDDVMNYARALSELSSPRSMAVIKSQLWRSALQSFDEALAAADDAMQASLRSDDFREGVAHFLEKRPPRFKDLERLDSGSVDTHAGDDQPSTGTVSNARNLGR